MSRRVHTGARAALGMLLAGILAGGLAACATTRPAAEAGAPIPVAASINAWGSILAQLGGDRVHEISIIRNPAADPHEYEPTPADARTVADARLFVENGIGYDPWAARTLAASPDRHRVVLDVGSIVGVATGGNPHRWYSPADVETVADAITASLQRIDPSASDYFAARRTAFETTGLARYHQLINAIRAHFAGTPIGASESIVVPLASALRLSVLTPMRFLDAISEGSDPSAADKALIDRQIADKQIAVYLYNTQNSTPDVTAQVAAARDRGIPVVGITETLSPADASFEDWQTTQLAALQAALSRAATT